MLMPYQMAGGWGQVRQELTPAESGMDKDSLLSWRKDAGEPSGNRKCSLR